MPQYGLQAAGVKSMLLQSDDEVVSSFFVEPEDEVVVLTSRGHIIKESAEGVQCYNRYRRGTLIVDRMKTNPHLVVDAGRLSKNQTREEVPIDIICEKGLGKLKASDLKYTANKYGRKVLETDEVGEPYKMLIGRAFADEIKVSKPAPAVKEKEEGVFDAKILAEEIETDDKVKIRISKFDLFDE